MAFVGPVQASIPIERVNAGSKIREPDMQASSRSILAHLNQQLTEIITFQ